MAMATTSEQRRWMHEAAEALDGRSLVRTLAEGVTSAQACVRVATLARFAPDAGIGEDLLAMLAQPPWRSASANPFWSLWCLALLHHVPPMHRLRRWEAQVADDGHLRNVDVDRATAWFLGIRIRRLVEILRTDAERAQTPLPPSVTAPELERALDDDDDDEAFRLAHRAWTRWRTPALTHAVRVLGERLERAPVGRRGGAVSWQDVAEDHDPADLPRLLAHIGASPPTSYLDHLLAWPHADPRIGELAAEQLVSPPWALVRPIAIGVAGLAILNPAPTMLDTMAPHLAHAPHLQLVSAAVGARLARFDEEPSIERLVASFVPIAAPRDPGAEALLEAIYDTPDDPSLRRVYGDLLLEEGDPRGELIALQSQGPWKRADRKRVRELVEEHFTEWVGLLGPILLPPGHRTKPPTWFEHGFLYAAALGSLGKLEDVRADDRAWSTVRELHLPPRLNPKDLRLLASPHLQGLRRLSGVPLERLRGLRGTLPALEHLTVTGRTDAADLDRLDTDWAQLAERTGLRHLWLTDWTGGPWMRSDAQPRSLKPLVGSAVQEKLGFVGLRVRVPGRREPLRGRATSRVSHLRRHLAAWLSFLGQHLPRVEVELFDDVSSREAIARVRRRGPFFRVMFMVPEGCPKQDPYRLLELVLAVLPEPVDTLTLVVPRKPRAMDRIEEWADRFGVPQVDLCETRF